MPGEREEAALAMSNCVSRESDRVDGSTIARSGSWFGSMVSAPVPTPLATQSARVQFPYGSNYRFYVDGYMRMTYPTNVQLQKYV